MKAYSGSMRQPETEMLQAAKYTERMNQADEGSFISNLE